MCKRGEMYPRSKGKYSEVFGNLSKILPTSEINVGGRGAWLWAPSGGAEEPMVVPW